MSGDDIEDWNRIAETYDGIAGASHDLVSALLGAELRSSLGDVAGRRVLDVGCGSGWLTSELVARGASVVGIDGSERLLEQARKRCPEVEFHRHDLRAGLPGLGGRFDCAVAHMVLMDVDPIGPLVRDVRSVLGREAASSSPSPIPASSTFDPAGTRRAGSGSGR